MHLIPQSVVLPGPPLRNEIWVDCVVPVDELQGASLREPIGKPELDRPALSADRVSDQIAIVRVPVAIAGIIITIKTPISRTSMVARADYPARRLCRNSFHMKIKFGNSRDSRDVYSRMPRIPRRVLHRQDVVFRVGISVEDDVVPKFRNIKGPVHFRI